MNLSKIQAFQNVTSAESSASVKRLQQIAEMSQAAGLSEAEQNMITNNFPLGQNKELELYMSSGNSVMENPDARGKNLDFRV